MADWKYIAYNQNYMQTLPIIFPASLNHVDVARQMHRLVSNAGRLSATVDSAGFIGSLAVVSCYGASESLGDLPHSTMDAETINTFPVHHGIRDSFLPQVHDMVRLKHIEMLMDQIRGER